jgi:hypothetical protein
MQGGEPMVIQTLIPESAIEAFELLALAKKIGTQP